jgi:LacI family transcriptional regulator
MSRVTHRDIAKRLGLSQCAISLALNDNPKIPLQTRQRVRTAAKEMGYRPNSLLSELAGSRWQGSKLRGGDVIAYIHRIRCDPGPRAAQLFSPLQEQASLLGYRLEIFHREDFVSSSKLQRVLRNRGITDIILGSVTEPALGVEFDWSKFITVQLLPEFFQLPFHSVTKGHFASVTIAWQKAVDYGYRRIGVVLLDDRSKNLPDDIHRASGVHACQTEHFPHLPVLPPLRQRRFDSKDLGEFADWVEKNEPDVIIGFQVGPYYHFQTLFGCTIPYITLHKTEDQHEFAGILEDEENCAREAVNLLHFCRRTFQWGIPKIRIDHTLEPRWSEGHSLPPKAFVSRGGTIARRGPLD